MTSRIMIMIKVNSKKVSIALLMFVYLVSTRIVLASPGTITIPNPLKNCGGASGVGCNSLYGFISTIINDVLLPVGGVIAVMYIIWAGFLLVTARGDETKLKEGKRAFTYAAIGTLVLLGAWAISQAIEGTINQLTGSGIVP